MLKEFDARFRLILSQKIMAPDKEHAEIIARKMAKQVFQQDPDFKYVEFDKIME